MIHNIKYDTHSLEINIINKYICYLQLYNMPTRFICFFFKCAIKFNVK